VHFTFEIIVLCAEIEPHEHGQVLPEDPTEKHRNAMDGNRYECHLLEGFRGGISNAAPNSIFLEICVFMSEHLYQK